MAKTKKISGWLNKYQSGTTSAEPTLTFTTRPVGAVNVGTTADNTSVVVNTPRGPVVTGAKTNVVANPEITKKVKQAQALQKMQQNVNFQRDQQGNIIKDSQGNPIIAPAAGTTTSVMDNVGEAAVANVINSVQGVGDVANEVYAGIANMGNIPIYTNGESYEDSYNNARKTGSSKFVWKNPSTGSIEVHDTKSDLPENEQLKKYGITDSQIEWNYYNPIKRHLGQNLYNNFTPFGYGYVDDKWSVADKLFNGLVLGEPTFAHDFKWGNSNYNGPTDEELKKDWDEKEKKDKNLQKRRDAIRMYAGIPQEHNTFSISQYADPKVESTTPGQKYYSINMTPEERIQYVNRFYNHLYKDPIDGTTSVDTTNYPLNKEIPLADDAFSIMGKYRSIKNKDDKGEYIDYYDKWDLDPVKLEDKFGTGVSNAAQAGNPMHIYDRIYVKDYGTDGNHWYKPVFYNDEQLKNITVNKDNAEAVEQELRNRGYKITKGNTQDLEKALQDFQNTNTQEKKKYGGWLNKYK